MAEKQGVRMLQGAVDKSWECAQEGPKRLEGNSSWFGEGSVV